MIVGAAVVELRVHGSHSLKHKRGVLNSIKRRLRNRFNVAVSEVGGQDTWQRAVLALATTGSRERLVRSELDKALSFIEEMHLAEVVGSDIETLRLPLADSGDGGPEAPPADPGWLRDAADAHAHHEDDAADAGSRRDDPEE